MRRFLIPLVLAVALAAGACGGGDEDAAGPNSAYCKQLKKTADDAVKQRTTTSAKDAAALAKAQEEEFNKILAAIVDKAPKELEDDYKAFEDFVTLRFELTRNPGLAQSDGPRIKAVQEKYTPAAKAISEYNSGVCKFQTTTTVRGATATTTVATAPAAATTTTAK